MIDFHGPAHEPYDKVIAVMKLGPGGAPVPVVRCGKLDDHAPAPHKACDGLPKSTPSESTPLG
ncbi:hypothetical protein ITP53_46800 [Nonomuraea sp. K274]|uniref:Uncharacterized protein n=1 Tax=Nonomuraea cypriaca TaxID=1187855 RepID=A0A931ALD0_9ACTN|nr:hypothetical protein [Nonomuraea cypriaca]MBF8193059.1 hypothetical protein [Nonomuraea cypriaca]